MLLAVTVATSRRATGVLLGVVDRGLRLLLRLVERLASGVCRPSSTRLTASTHACRNSALAGESGIAKPYRGARTSSVTASSNCLLPIDW